MGEFIPELLDEGKQPRVMLEYSGTLLHGLRRDGPERRVRRAAALTRDPDLRHAVEWLGCPWGHAVAPSTPVQDYRLHVRAWQHHFAAIFGLEALGRVRGFSPAEMALPNHPDVAYEFVKTLHDCGYEWVLVQEHTVEQPDGRPRSSTHLPHRLVCHQLARRDRRASSPSSRRRAATPSSSAQMQPYYEAKGLSRLELAGQQVPPLVTQIADGENGGVMMNEFPPKYLEVVREARGSPTPLLNVTEYLEQLFATGISRERPAGVAAAVPEADLGRMAARRRPGAARRRSSSSCAHEDDRFHVEGGSWTNDISWVRGYDHVLVPMEQVSSLFHERVLARASPATTPLPQRPVSPAVRRDQLLPLLGPGRSGPTTAPSSAAASSRHHHAFPNRRRPDQPRLLFGPVHAGWSLDGPSIARYSTQSCEQIHMAWREPL